MGCCTSKKKLNSLLAKSEYRLNALNELMPLKRSPRSLDPERDVDGFISVHLFHNLFYNGFYAPYICNPRYMLVVDCRSECDHQVRHVRLSSWRGHLPPLKESNNGFNYVILYDDQSEDWQEVSEKLKLVFQQLKDRGVTPLCVRGGFLQLKNLLPYMLTAKKTAKTNADSQQKELSEHLSTGVRFPGRELQWYPSWVSDALLLGRADQASSPEVIGHQHITHIIDLLPSGAGAVFGRLSYLHVPLEDNPDQNILTPLPRIFDFITEATKSGGVTLIHCDQGVNRAAVVVLAYLMASHGCTLEDSYYHLQSLRPTIQPAFYFLKQLIRYEAQIFGRKLSNVDDLNF